MYKRKAPVITNKETQVKTPISGMDPAIPETYVKEHKTEESGVQSKQKKFRHAAVSSGVDFCSEIGKEILAKQGGSAVDAAIATVLCIGLGSAHSSGIGGGHFMTVYTRENRTAVTINARDRAPKNATADMFLQSDTSPTEGGLSVAVPGEIMGLYEAHKRFGRVPWKSLFLPPIKLCQEGITVLGSLATAIELTQSRGFLNRYPNLRQMLTNPETGTIYKEGEKMRRPKLAKTLQIIADEGPAAFYKGQLAKDIASDIQDAGGIVTAEDLENYTVSVDEPLVYEQENGFKVLTPRLPSSGPLVSYILNILDGYHFTKESIHTKPNAILTYHRIVEAFKFAYAKRTDLGDEAFVHGIEKVMQNMTSRGFGASIREMIHDGYTHDLEYYGATFYDIEKPGTTHVSVLAANGDAVSITSTINLYFGSKVVGHRTGIVFNDSMDDFSTPNITNYYGVEASPANIIQPGKRPLSAMAPVIVVDGSGDVTLVVGAAGGTQIPTTVAQIVLGILAFGQDPKTAIDSPRIHHQLLPHFVKYDDGFDQDIVNGLKAKRHQVENIEIDSNCNVILQSGGSIVASGDYRKKGSAPDGY